MHYNYDGVNYTIFFLLLVGRNTTPAEATTAEISSISRKLATLEMKVVRLF